MLDCINSSSHLVFVHWSELNGNSNINLVWVVFGTFFWCTNFPSCVHMTRTSRNANLSSCSSSIVKFMFGSTLFK